jgi:hypothetical protein
MRLDMFRWTRMEAVPTAVLLWLLIHRHEGTLVAVPPSSATIGARLSASPPDSLLQPVRRQATYLRSSRCRVYETSVMSSVKFETGIRTGSGRTSSRRKPNALWAKYACAGPSNMLRRWRVVARKRGEIRGAAHWHTRQHRTSVSLFHEEIEAEGHLLRVVRRPLVYERLEAAVVLFR